MSRQEEVAQERRRRQPGTLDRMSQLKLTVPDSVKAKYPDDEFRFINDSGTRIFDKTVNDDWTKVEEQLAPPVPVGTDGFGKPIMAYLCKKPRAFVQEDAKALVDATVEQERGIMRGQQVSTTEPPVENAYVPKGNSITTAFTP